MRVTNSRKKYAREGLFFGVGSRFALDHAGRGAPLTWPASKPRGSRKLEAGMGLSLTSSSDTSAETIFVNACASGQGSDGRRSMCFKSADSSTGSAEATTDLGGGAHLNGEPSLMVWSAVRTLRRICGEMGCPEEAAEPMSR